jgi:cobaltochelatase CobT
MIPSVVLDHGQPRTLMLPLLPLFVGLKHRFANRSGSPEDGDYRVFTTAFDETVNASDLPRILPKLTPMEAVSFEEAVRRFESEFSGERITHGVAAAELVRNLQGRLTDKERARAVVSFLIDHSGSMRGLRMLSALLAIETAVDALENAGIATEILGFTTRNWKGGRSRRAWRWAGRPRNPGRLCDIRHIIYGTADRPSKMPWHLRQALRPGLLHENIDGEALQWAGSRLDPVRWDQRIICVISDGAPVDDSTLVANEDRSLLVRHLKTIENSLRSNGITVGFLLIGAEHVREPDLHERAAEPEAAGLSLIKLVRRALIPPASG